MASGKVKWFNNAKGYGFINEDGKQEDLFAHFSAIRMDGFKTVKANQPVTFDIVQGPKGMQALNIVIVDTPATTDVGTNNRNADSISTKQHA